MGLFSLFIIPLNETITNTYFLAPFYCSGHLIHCLEISGNKNNLKEQFEDKIAKNLITAQPQPKVTGSYKKFVYTLRMRLRGFISFLIEKAAKVFSNQNL